MFQALGSPARDAEGGLDFDRWISEVQDTRDAPPGYFGAMEAIADPLNLPVGKGASLLGKQAKRFKPGQGAEFIDDVMGPEAASADELLQTLINEPTAMRRVMETRGFEPTAQGFSRQGGRPDPLDIFDMGAPRADVPETARAAGGVRAELDPLANDPERLERMLAEENAGIGDVDADELMAAFKDQRNPDQFTAKITEMGDSLGFQGPELRQFGAIVSKRLRDGGSPSQAIEDAAGFLSDQRKPPGFETMDQTPEQLRAKEESAIQLARIRDEERRVYDKFRVGKADLPDWEEASLQHTRAAQMAGSADTEQAVLANRVRRELETAVDRSDSPQPLVDVVQEMIDKYGLDAVENNLQAVDESGNLVRNMRGEPTRLGQPLEGSPQDTAAAWLREKPFESERLGVALGLLQEKYGINDAIGAFGLVPGKPISPEIISQRVVRQTPQRPPSQRVQFGEGAQASRRRQPGAPGQQGAMFRRVAWGRWKKAPRATSRRSCRCGAS